MPRERLLSSACATSSSASATSSPSTMRRIDIRRGEIHALVGENGAGKSTLMNILYGLLQRSDGEIELRRAAGALRQSARRRSPRASAWCTSISSWRRPSPSPKTSFSGPSR